MPSATCSGARALILVLLIILVAGPGFQAEVLSVEAGWEILLVAMALSLVFWALRGMKSLSLFPPSPCSDRRYPF